MNGCKACEGGLDQDPRIHDLNRAGTLGSCRKGILISIGFRADECAATYMSPDRAFGFEKRERFSEVVPGDAQKANQFTFRWQTLSGSDLFVRNEGAKLNKRAVTVVL